LIYNIEMNRYYDGRYYEGIAHLEDD